MGNHHGKEGGESQPEGQIAKALAGVKAWGLHGVWVVWWWQAQNSEPAGTLAAGYARRGGGRYKLQA
jgi:hypothetical protein